MHFKRLDHQRPPSHPKVHNLSEKLGFYRYKCQRVDCEEKYVRESGRIFGERFKEHLKALSPIYDNDNFTCHTKTIENASTAWYHLPHI